MAISWTLCVRSCALSPLLLVTLPYKGWGSARGTELTSCLCDLSGVDYNREWEEEPLAPPPVLCCLPGTQDNLFSSYQAILGLRTAQGDITTEGQSFLQIPLASLLCLTGCKRRSS